MRLVLALVAASAALAVPLSHVDVDQSSHVVVCVNGFVIDVNGIRRACDQRDRISASHGVLDSHSGKSHVIGTGQLGHTNAVHTKHNLTAASAVVNNNYNSTQHNAPHPLPLNSTSLSPKQKVQGAAHKIINPPKKSAAVPKKPAPKVNGQHQTGKYSSLLNSQDAPSYRGGSTAPLVDVEILRPQGSAKGSLVQLDVVPKTHERSHQPLREVNVALRTTSPTPKTLSTSTSRVSSPVIKQVAGRGEVGLSMKGDEVVSMPDNNLPTVNVDIFPTAQQMAQPDDIITIGHVKRVDTFESSLREAKVVTVPAQESNSPEASADVLSSHQAEEKGDDADLDVYSLPGLSASDVDHALARIGVRQLGANLEVSPSIDSRQSDVDESIEARSPRHDNHDCSRHHHRHEHCHEHRQLQQLPTEA